MSPQTQSAMQEMQAKLTTEKTLLKPASHSKPARPARPDFSEQRNSWSMKAKEPAITIGTSMVKALVMAQMYLLELIKSATGPRTLSMQSVNLSSMRYASFVREVRLSLY